MQTTRQQIVSALVAGVPEAELKLRFPNFSTRTWTNYRRDARQHMEEAINIPVVPPIERERIPQCDQENNSNHELSSESNQERKWKVKVSFIAKIILVILVLLLLSASFFTIQEVSSKVFSIAPVTGYCVAFAITLTPIAVIFTDGNLTLRVAIQVIAFCIEMLCNVVVIAQSQFLDNIVKTLRVEQLTFAWVIGLVLALFALACNVYLNQLQKKSTV
ncbi:hypothetical protein D3C80_923900 [compost metagenome]